MRVLFLALLLAAPAAAQNGAPLWDIEADLDGDGAADRFGLRDNGDGMVDLVVEAAGGTRVVPGLAWLGGMVGQEPELALSPAGSLLVTSRNDSIGRDRWTLTLTVAHRDGDLRVAGITYTWYDTLDPEAGWGRCDLNLLSGRGRLETAAGARDVAAPFAAPALWDWRNDGFNPLEACGAA